MLGTAWAWRGNQPSVCESVRVCAHVCVFVRRTTCHCDWQPDPKLRHRHSTTPLLPFIPSFLQSSLSSWLAENFYFPSLRLSWKNHRSLARGVLIYSTNAPVKPHLSLSLFPTFFHSFSRLFPPPTSLRGEFNLKFLSAPKSDPLPTPNSM